MPVGMSGFATTSPGTRRRILAPNDAITSQPAAMALTPRAFAPLSAILHPGLTQATVRRGAAAQTRSRGRVQLRRNRRKTCRRPSKPSSPSASWPSSLPARSKKSRRLRRSSSPSRSWASTKVLTARLAAPAYAAARLGGPRRIVSVVGPHWRQFPAAALKATPVRSRDRPRLPSLMPSRLAAFLSTLPVRSPSQNPSRRNRSSTSTATRFPSAGLPIGRSTSPTRNTCRFANPIARPASNLRPAQPRQFACRLIGTTTSATYLAGRAPRVRPRPGREAADPTAPAAVPCRTQGGRPC